MRESENYTLPALVFSNERAYFIGIKIHAQRGSRVHRFSRFLPTRQATKPATTGRA
jgi:hypothetical protein